MVDLLRRVSLTQWILLSMVAGVLFGWAAPEQAVEMKVVSTLFLKMIKCILVPLVFGTLVVGIASHSDDLKGVGRLAFRSILYFEVVTTLALIIGLAVVNVLQPGKGVKLTAPANAPPAATAPAVPAVAPATASAAAAPAAKPPKKPLKQTFQEIIEHIVPTSFFEAAAKNDVLQVVFFALLFAVALAQVPAPQREPVLRFCESLTEVMFKFTGLVMKFAPIGIGAAMAYSVGHGGLQILGSLGMLIGTLYVGLAIFCVAVLLPTAWIARIPVLAFLKAIKEPAILAFSTTSSDAAMPDAMKRMIAFGVPRKIVSFVMPLGYSFNLDGSTLYLAVASVFVAQAAGVEFGLGKQLLMLLTLMLTSKGMAGIPRASSVILAGTLVSFDLPIEGVALIMGVDELMDMARTTVNLTGNCLATGVMARWEGTFRTEQPAPAETPAAS